MYSKYHSQNQKSIRLIYLKREEFFFGTISHVSLLEMKKNVAHFYIRIKSTILEYDQNLVKDGESGLRCLCQKGDTLVQGNAFYHMKCWNCYITA